MKKEASKKVGDSNMFFLMSCNDDGVMTCISCMPTHEIARVIATLMLRDEVIMHLVGIMVFKLESVPPSEIIASLEEHISMSVKIDENSDMQH